MFKTVVMMNFQVASLLDPVQRVRLVKGMHLGKVTETTNKIQHVFANSEPDG